MKVVVFLVGLAVAAASVAQTAEEVLGEGGSDALLIGATCLGIAVSMWGFKVIKGAFS